MASVSEMCFLFNLTPAAFWIGFSLLILLLIALRLSGRPVPWLSRRPVPSLSCRPVPKNQFEDDLLGCEHQFEYDLLSDEFTPVPDLSCRPVPNNQFEHQFEDDLLGCVHQFEYDQLSDELIMLPLSNESSSRAWNNYPPVPGLSRRQFEVQFKDDLLSDELIKLPLPRNNEAKKAKKRAKKARKRGGDSSYATVHVTPKVRKKLNLVPAGLSCPDIHGMINYEMKVLDFLEHNTGSLLGIYGKRGMGKSTLLRLVRTSSSRYDSPFNYVFCVEAGIGFTAGMLRDVLARNIGLDPTLAVPEVSLISGFLRDESFVLLIDDVRASFDLAAAGLPLPLGPWQKVVFTTRNESICAEMGCVGNTITMECLARDVAWDLFRDNVGGEIIDADLEIEDLAKEMVAECRGIPSAICTIGRFMADQTDVRQWRIACEMLKIKRSPLHEVEEMDDEGYPRLDFF